MVATEGTFWRSPVYVDQNLLGTVNTCWTLLVIIALSILTSICNKVLIIKINFLPTLRLKEKHVVCTEKTQVNKTE